jgi:hypothetical protein
MACNIQYTITNNSTTPKTFQYIGCTGSPTTIVVGGLATETFNADSIVQPTQITTGIDENDFLNSSTYNPPNGFAYLWNDGTKVKHIKISNIAANGQSLSSFVRQADWVKFLMTEAKNSDGSYTHPSSYLFPQPEQYVLRNATIENGYSHLFINQNSPLTSTAVSSENPNYLNFNFTGSGDIILYDTASGDITDPIFNPSPEPQGYFPRNIESEGIEEQFFKEYDGPINDSLGFFNEDTGIYTFGLSSTETIKVISNISITGSTPDSISAADYGTAEYGVDEYGGTGTAPEAITWETASLKLYVNNFPVETSTIYIDDISSPENINLTYSYIPSIGDTLKMSLDVTGSQANKTALNSALLVTDYTLSVSASVPPASDLVPTYFNNSISIIDDCDPFLNNIVGDRPNERLQDVDYSVDALDPINFKQIIRNEAVRATVPESNYTQLGFSNQRYNGSSTTREKINDYLPLSEIDSNNRLVYDKFIGYSDEGKGPGLGKVSNIELNNAYIGYFNKIIDPYPTLNNKTAYYIKYMIDENGTVFEPSLSDINYSILSNTFRLQDYDLKPTRANTSIQNIEEAKELSRLEKGISPVFKVGEYPVPILYTQTSSIGHVNEISLSGSKFYTELGPDGKFSDYGATAYTTQSVTPSTDPTNAQPYPTTLIDFDIADITLKDPTLGTGSYEGNGIFDFGEDANALIPNTLGENLSDKYEVDGTFKMYTTSIPADYQRDTHFINGESPENQRMMDFFFDVYQKVDITNPTSAYARNANGFTLTSATLNILVYDYPDGMPNYSNPEKYTIEIPVNARHGTRGGELKVYNNQGISFKLDSRWLEQEICNQLSGAWNTTTRKANRPLIGGGWGGQGIGCTKDSTLETKYEWVFNYKLGGQPNYLRQGSGYYFESRGYIQPDGFKSDYFLEITDSGEYKRNTSKRWNRAYFPDIGETTEDYIPNLSLNIKSSLNTDQNGAVGPFWVRVPSTTNQLFMSSSVLNQTYGVKGEDGEYSNYFVQAKLPYTASTNTDFPLTVEPDFTEFDPIEDVWSLEVGDEIRFENSEDLVYKITSVGGQSAITPPDESPDGMLRIVVTPSFEEKSPSNFDFFVVRRYKENKNFIIMDQQKPYGFPVSASSSPGILLPEHRIEKFNANPDSVLKDLIEKNII